MTQLQNVPRLPESPNLGGMTDDELLDEVTDAVAAALSTIGANGLAQEINRRPLGTPPCDAATEAKEFGVPLLSDVLPIARSQLDALAARVGVRFDERRESELTDA